MKIPTQEELDAVIQAFDESWGAVDEVLYRACREHPLHNDRRAIMCKMVVVGRCYAAGIERLVTPRKGEQAVDRIGDCLARHGAVIDGIIQGLPDPEAPLTPAPMRIVVRQHGRLTRLLARHLTKGRYPTSFVSKYLHFHRPIVPIYDAYCLAGLTKAVPTGIRRRFPSARLAGQTGATTSSARGSCDCTKPAATPVWRRA